MKIWDKIKNSIFEEDEFEETEVVNEAKEPPVVDTFKDEVVKKIDIEKTIPKKIELPKEEVEEKKPILPKREHRVTPVIFDEDDFIIEDEPIPVAKKEEKKEEIKRPLYSGYKDDKQKEKFKPSPILSPVYGLVGVSPVLEQPRKEDLSSFNEMFAKEKKETVTVDDVRQKAYGTIPSDKAEEDDDLDLLYEMKQDESPAISKITLGDAEEYFDDLGLEYNVDYTDSAKESVKPAAKESKKVTDVTEDTLEETDLVLEDIQETKLESTRDLEITKEQLKPKTAKEIKKVKNIKDLNVDEETEEEPDEKNLYDLIDMMYESKE